MEEKNIISGDNHLKINEWVDVEPIHCHARLPQNTLVTKVRYISEDRVSTEVLHKVNPKELIFFFDHPIDHLPGMLMASAIRQACLAVSHLIYEVPLDFVEVIDWMNLRFLNYGGLDKQTWTKGKLLGLKKSSGKIEITIEGTMWQEDYPIFKAKGKMICFSPRLAEKIRHKKIQYTPEQLEV